MPKSANRYTYYKQKKLLWMPKKKNSADASSANPPPPLPPWVELPRDITANILHRLGPIEVLQSALKVCTTWRSVCLDPAMWCVIDLPDSPLLTHSALNAVCRYAVDLSQGKLLDITIEDFCTDDLLLYIAQRANQLRRLRLVYCDTVSSECLSKVAAQFPSLQELQIYNSKSMISNECIKTFGCSCPLITSFTLNNYGLSFSVEIDDGALAVAENMHGLRRLALYGNTMTDEGVQAILDGCPHLESLDLRRCFNVNLIGDLGDRCSKQIKDLKRPDDSNSGCEFCYKDDDDPYSSDGFSADYDSDYHDFMYSPFGPLSALH